MSYLSSIGHRWIAMATFSAVLALPVGATTQATAVQDDRNTRDNSVQSMGAPVGTRTPRSPFRPGVVMTAPAFAPLFVTAEDAHRYWEMLVRSYGESVLDPRAIARSFIRERLDIDGDAFVVAHFATTEKRMEGSADNVMVLTDALMNAFPDHSRHTFFGAFSDGVAGLNGGGQSPSLFGFLQELSTCASAKECFSRAGRFLWSRTGPGYIYNTFIGEGSVVDSIREDTRPLDLAFGIYPRTSNFLPENSSSLQLSQVIDKFKEEGAFSELPYIKRLHAKFDEYWNSRRTEWPQLARYRFVHEARRALRKARLTRQQFELVMKGGAPRVPLQGAIELAQLGNSPADTSVQVRRFDINGYAASDIVRFIAGDGSEVIYIPGDSSPFVTFRNGREVREWVVRQARNRASLDALLSHFSIYNGQDGAFRTGVAQALAHLADGRWNADDRAIDVVNAPIRGDVFEDMCLQVEARLRDDARMRTSTAWDAWRTTLNRTVAVLGPLGYVPPLAIPVQSGATLVALGTEIDEGINGRTTAERNNALGNAVMTLVTNGGTGAALREFTPNDRKAPVASSPLLPEIERVPPSPPVSAADATSGTPTLPSLAIASPSPTSLGTGARVGFSMGAVTSDNSSPGTQVRSWRAGTPASGETRANSASDPGGVRDGTSPREDDGTGSLDLQALERQEGKLGYVVQRVSNDADAWVRRIIDLKKSAIDDQRHRLDDFRDESLTTNRVGYRLSFDRSLVFRVDSRRPSELLQGEGFGPSGEFNDLVPMLNQPSTIGSGSLLGSNVVLESWQRGFACLVCKPSFHQYAVWTDRRPVATASDNHESHLYDSILDEVHFPADVPSRDIYIVDSADPTYARALANIYRSPYVSTPYGVPLEAFQEYLSGQLDISAPNRFTERRPSAVLTPGVSNGQPATASQPAG